tara:strand:- start:416 stop:574 length:159 start_codon:yes stop_codon:yes gene_type:complete
MTAEQQTAAINLLKRAIIYAPFQIIERPETPKSLGNEIEDFLATATTKEAAE